MNPQKMPLDTLEKLTEARNYNQWIYKLCQPYLGARILEIGSGIGNMTGIFLGHGSRVLATDMDPQRLDKLRKQWPEQKKLDIAAWDLNKAAPEKVSNFNPDTILCINVLEHIENDLAALQRMSSLLVTGGKLLLYVPALAWIYGTLDAELHHFRRYGMKEVGEITDQAGFIREKLHYVNMLGVPGWWWNNRIIKSRCFSSKQVKLFDRLVPLAACLEQWLKPCLGQSLFYAGITL
ncbi:class I SAM-dependent methyltransferase [bacterium]|nr:class I SAM-dependent methyltransferase [bacterium]